MLNNNVEIWKPVKGYETYYQVSNLGNIRSIKSPQGNYRERPKKSFIGNSGYPTVDLWKNNKGTKHSVHRLVCIAFLDNPDNKPTVNHIDGNKENNEISNLEWNTYSENHIHAFDTGLKSREDCKQRMLGTKSKNSKSNYHNVSYDNSRSKWIGSIKIDRKTVGNKRFDNEVDAAKYVNHLLDLYGITDRPRNIV